MHMRNTEYLAEESDAEESSERRWPAMTAGWTVIDDDMRLNPDSFDLAHHVDGQCHLISPRIEELQGGNVRFLYSLVNGSFETTRHLNGNRAEVLERFTGRMPTNTKVFLS